MLQPAHISAIGLVFDIVGFLFLAFDILPEYARYKLRRRNRLEHAKAADEFRAAADDRDWQTNDVLAAMFTERDFTAPVDQLRRLVGLAPVKLVDANGRFLSEVLRGSEQEFEAALTAREKQVGTRRRPWVGAGVLLVVLGFALQIAGTLLPLWRQ